MEASGRKRERQTDRERETVRTGSVAVHCCGAEVTGAAVKGPRAVAKQFEGLRCNHFGTHLTIQIITSH